MGEFTVDGHCPAGVFVGSRVFQLDGEFCDLGFSFLDFFFEAFDFFFNDAAVAAFGVTGFGFGAFAGALVAFVDGRGVRRICGDGFGAAGEAGAGGFGVSLLQIIIVPAGEVAQATGVDVDGLLRNQSDEMNVVADENKRAFVLLECGDEGIDAGDIEMGSGLIHQ